MDTFQLLVLSNPGWDSALLGWRNERTHSQWSSNGAFSTLKIILSLTFTFFKMLSNVSNFSLYIFYCMCFYERTKKKQKTKPNPTKRTGWGGGKGFVLYFNCKIANPRIMFTFMFSVVQSLGHFIQTSAFSSLAASLTEGRARSCSMPGAELPRKEFPPEVGFPWGRRENLCWTFLMIVLRCFCGPKWKWEMVSFPTSAWPVVLWWCQ